MSVICATHVMSHSVYCQLVRKNLADLTQFIYTNLFAVFRVGKVNEVIIVHLLGVDDVTVLLLAQVFGVNAIGSQELLVSYAECLADGLSDKLRLQAEKSRNHKCVCDLVLLDRQKLIFTESYNNNNTVGGGNKQSWH